VYGYSSANRINWFNATTGAFINQVILTGDGSENPGGTPETSIALNPVDHDLYWLASADNGKFIHFSNTTHTYTVATGAVTNYGSQGGIICDSSGRIYVFAGNSTLVIYRLNTSGVTQATITTGLGGGDVFLKYDTAKNIIIFAIGLSVGILDCATDKILGVSRISTVGSSMAYDNSRLKIYLAQDSFYSWFQA
jgi:hypothetical protein